MRIEVSTESSYPFGDERESRIVIKVQPRGEHSFFPTSFESRRWAEGATCGVWDDPTTFERINDSETGVVLDLGPRLECQPAD